MLLNKLPKTITISAGIATMLLAVLAATLPAHAFNHRYRIEGELTIAPIFDDIEGDDDMMKDDILPREFGGASAVMYSPASGGHLFVSSNIMPDVGVANISDNGFDTFATPGADADGVHYDEMSDTLYEVDRTNNVINVFQDVYQNLSMGMDPILAFSSTSDFTNGREIAMSGDLLVVAQDAADSNGNQNALFVYQVTPNSIGLVAEYEVDINLWGIRADGNDLFAVVDNSSDVAIFEDFFSLPDEPLTPSETFTVEGLVRTHGIDVDSAADLMVLTDIGEASMDDDGAVLTIYNFSNAIADGIITMEEQIRDEDDMLGNPVDVAIDMDNFKLYVAERAVDGGKVVSLDLPEMVMPDMMGTVEILQSQGNLNILIGSLFQAGLFTTVADLENVTILAPTDQAFFELSGLTLLELFNPSNNGPLTDVLTFHVIPQQLTKEKLSAMSSVETLSGEEIVNPGDIDFAETNIQAEGGVTIHVINEVLMPME